MLGKLNPVLAKQQERIEELDEQLSMSLLRFTEANIKNQQLQAKLNKVKNIIKGLKANGVI